MCSVFHTGRREVVQPEVVTRRRHQEQDDERRQTERLERELTDRRVACVADEHAHERIERAERSGTGRSRTRRGQRQREHHHAQMATVVEERQEPAVQSRQRADAEDDVQQRERRGAEGPDQQRFDRQLRAQRGLDAEATRQGTRRSALAATRS